MRYRLPAGLAYVFGDVSDPDDHSVYLVRLPDGHPMVLQDSAALIWSIAIEGGDVLPAVAEAAGQAPDSIAPDVATFLEMAVAEGLLTPDPEEDSP